jgi:ubiquinone/menaquinone biosynthesis C-methylase UbiE
MADLACGTGTLLMAAAEAVTDNYVGAVSEHGGMHDVDVVGEGE